MKIRDLENVRKPGWLFGFEEHIHRRTSDKLYRVEVHAALPGGEAV